MEPRLKQGGKIAALLGVVTVSVALSGCVIVDTDRRVTSSRVSTGTVVKVDVDTRRLEPIYGAWFDEAGLNVKVSSNGCTDKGSFEVTVDHPDRLADDVGRLSLRRIKPDNCRALIREGKVLVWTRDELQMKSSETVALGNPVKTW